jgi:hypothetical protein
MISGRTKSNRLVARLAAKAEALAGAAAETRRRAARSDPARWRRAALLWPLFTRNR